MSNASQLSPDTLIPDPAISTPSTGSLMTALRQQKHAIASLIETATRMGSPSHTNINDIPRFEISGRHFILGGLLHKKGKARSSWVYGHGWLLTELELKEQPQGKVRNVKEDFFCCRQCDANGVRKLYVATATTGIANHLRRYENALIFRLIVIRS
jgi:hypothetical protein